MASAVYSSIQSFIISTRVFISSYRFFAWTSFHFNKDDTVCFAFFAAIYLLRRDKLGFVFIALFAGSLTVSFYTSIFIVASIVMFLIFYRLFFWIDALPKRLPVVVFFASIFAKTGMIYTWGHEWTIYEGMTMLIEAGLGSILTLIFYKACHCLIIKNISKR